MPLRLDKEVPNFSATTTMGQIDFYKWAKKSWVLLLSHPGDFTPICTTELGSIASIEEELAKRNVKPIGLSVDPIESHLAWVNDIESSQNVKMNFPVIADPSRRISIMLDMIHQFDFANNTVRSLFIIDPKRRVRLTMTYPLNVGRNVHEILRVIDALQLADNYQVATPANWKQTEDVVISTEVPDQDIPKKFPKGFTKVLSYLRMTPQPDH